MATLPPRLSQLPMSASQIQHLTNGNTSTFAYRARQRMVQQSKALFAPPRNIIKPWKSITGGQEWVTSTYSYNKNTSKTIPTAQNVTDKLLRDYVTMVEDTGLGHSAKSSAARQATTARRRALEKMYVTSSTAKDYGDKIVVNAFVYDAAAGAQRAREKLTADRAKTRKQTSGPSARRRGPGAGSVGTAGARRFGGAGTLRRVGPPGVVSRSEAPRRIMPSGGNAAAGVPRRSNPSDGNAGRPGQSQEGTGFRTFRPSTAVPLSGASPSRSPIAQEAQSPSR